MDKTRILAVDCSLRMTGLALAAEGKTVASESQDLGRRQSAELPLMAERLLAETGWTWDDIGLVAVTNGPGYFTGIRVGAAWASALAYGLGVPVVPVSSLEMLAYPAGGGILSVVYAGRSAVYAASFGCDNPLEQGEYGGADIAGWLAGHTDVTVVSDDATRASEALGLEHPLPIREVRPDVRRLAELAWGRRGEAVSPMALRMTYCRSPL